MVSRVPVLTRSRESPSKVSLHPPERWIVFPRSGLLEETPVAAPCPYRYFRLVLIVVGDRVQDLYCPSRVSLVVVCLVLSLRKYWAILVQMLPRTVPALRRIASGWPGGVRSFFWLRVFLLRLRGSLLGISKIVFRFHGPGHQGR